MRPRPAIVGVAVGAVALALLAATINEPTPPFSKSAAILAAERSDSARSFLTRNVPTRRTVIPLDRKQWRVTYWHGQDELLDLAIGRDGRVAASEEHPPGEHAPGAASVQRGPLVVLLALLFVAALATRPLVSMRNLDAVVIGALFTSAAVIIDARAIAPRVWVGAAGLAYVALRCAQVAFGAAGDEGSGQPLIRSNRLVAILAVATL